MAKQLQFRRFCVQDRTRIPTDRLAKGYITCSPECAVKDRKAYKRFRKAINLQKLVTSPLFRSALKQARDSVTVKSKSVA